jgi:opacity protein-like surface antigen
MRTFFKGGLMLALLVLVPMPGWAQSRISEHGYVVGLGGAAATDVTTGFFGVSAGFNVAPHLLITVDAGRLQDVLADFTSQDLSQLEQGVNSMSAPFGVKLTASVRMPTNYYTAGVRVPFFAGRSARPYLSASAGLAHMSPAPNFTFSYPGTTENIDVMNHSHPACAWLTDSGCLGPAFREENRPMASIGGGVALTVARHMSFDFGYKYSGIFIKSDYLQDVQGSPHSHTRIDTHRFFAGVGFAF